MRHRAWAISLTVAALGVAACSTDSGVRATRSAAGSEGSTPDTGVPSTDTTGTTLPEASAIDWGPCTDPIAKDAVLECATLTVPLDYEHPNGDTIDLALVRVPATSSRKGAVLFNPGGPGGSGFDPIAQSGTVIQSELGLDHFDIVGFDPRGVDRSNGIRCVSDAVMDANLYLDDTPDTPDEQKALDDADSAFVDGCKGKYGDTLRFYSTANTARDMDMIRAGLGDEQMSFLGISYGTYLGGVYATLFPDRVRGMVLDSAFEPNGDTVEQQYLTQLVGFENAFNDWAKWCQDDTTCAFHAADVGARWDALRQRLDDQPLTASDGRLGNQVVLETATTAALYSKSEWPVLASALADAEKGDAAGIFSLADDYKGRKSDGTFDTLFQSIGVILCASGIEDQPPPDPQALLQKLQAQAPRFSKGITVDDLTQAGNDCKDLMPSQQVVNIDYQGDGPIVVVGGTNDPATPIRWAEEMTSELGPNARLVKYTGEGHGQLLASKCVTEVEGDLLSSLSLPDEGKVCDPDPVVEQPGWWGDLPLPDGVSEVVDLAAVKAALGLSDTLGYGETRTSDLTGRQVLDAYGTALDGAGFRSLGEQDIGISGVLDGAFMSPEGDVLLVITMDPEAFDTEELGSAKGSVPAGKTVILLAYVPN